MADATSESSLPRRDAFDVLSQLHELLSRIDHHATSEEATTGRINTANDAVYTDSTPLEPRDLPKEMLIIKTKLRRTVRELEKLPDINKTIGEQELEIEDLEKRIQAQQALLSKMRAATRVD